ncbi:MAG: cation:proton antiporter [Oxalobacter sp.]|nr:cation:proton antiporter [Oxalobacter sp.]
MNSAHWFLLTGGLLLAIGISSSVLRRLPVSSSMLYLAVGIVVGPTGLNLFHFNPLKQSAFLEALTEVAVLISLFSAGVKMPVPIKLRLWKAPVLLATTSMMVSVGLTTLFGWYILKLPLGAAILLGAIVAPTDPVLATDVQSRRPGDSDRLRFTLTCEAGMNDGSAFPFVILGMGLLSYHKLGSWVWKWALTDILWATIAGIAIGWAIGYLMGLLVSRVHQKYRSGLLDDFLGLGLIGVVYGVSEICDTWGFLAVFAAAVALRQAESRAAQRIAQGKKVFALGSSQAAGAVQKPMAMPDGQPFVSSSSLVFHEYLERLSELVLILLVGGTLFISSWSLRSVGLSLFLFFVVRPLSVYIGMLPQRGLRRVKGLSAWFGVRGIGSLYYLMYVINNGIAEPLALELIHLVLIVITMSIVMHGATVKPLLTRFWRHDSEDEVPASQNK